MLNQGETVLLPDQATKRVDLAREVLGKDIGAHTQSFTVRNSRDIVQNCTLNSNRSIDKLIS